ncbi:MAG: thiamine biosynthesis protein ThiS [Nitrospiria bacterium]
MKIIFQHPERIKEIKGPMKVEELLIGLNIMPETVLVILRKEGKVESDELLPLDSQIEDHESVEIRPVISGGSQ